MISFAVFLSVVFFLGYAILIFYFRLGWQRSPDFILKKEYTPSTVVSIIIPARNEAKNIGPLLEHILAQYYPPELTEIIVVDDHSEDATAEIVRQFKRVTLLTLSDFTGGEKLNAYKKKAIDTAIRKSRGQLIITTDADCVMCEFWLLSVVYFFEKYRHKLIAAPVAFLSNTNWFAVFQSIDFFTMQGITAALSFFKTGTMCNGANLAYTREAFEAVNGFQGIDDIASGDDMLLMYKIEKHFPRQTAYLKCKDAIVYTQPMDSFKNFFTQRIRWASKALKFEDRRLTFILTCVFAFNAFFVLLLLLSLYKIAFLKLFLALLISKGLLELFFLIPVSKFFYKQKELLLSFPLQIVHIFYILFSALLSQFGTYQWKGRTVK